MSMGVDQLQLTEDVWEDEHSYKIRLPKNKKYIYVQTKYLPYKHYEKCKRGPNGNKTRNIKQKCELVFSDSGYEMDYPVWSLRPAMDRVSKVLNVGYFNEDPKFWPVHFEIEWAYNWIMQPGGAVKAGIICSKRQKGHSSFSVGQGGFTMG
jgi:hypothetical protein